MKSFYNGSLVAHATKVLTQLEAYYRQSAKKWGSKLKGFFSLCIYKQFSFDWIWSYTQLNLYQLKRNLDNSRKIYHHMISFTSGFKSSHKTRQQSVNYTQHFLCKMKVLHFHYEIFTVLQSKCFRQIQGSIVEGGSHRVRASHTFLQN